MIKYFLIFLIFFLNNCSFDKRSGIWTQNESLQSTNKDIETLFEKEESIKNEFNPNFFIKTPLKLTSNKPEYTKNNYGTLNKNLNFEKISRYKFSKIDNFDPLRDLWHRTQVKTVSVQMCLNGRHRRP